MFGPVLSVIPFDDDAQAIEIANDVQFGPSAGVWTQDMIHEHLQAKSVLISTAAEVPDPLVMR